MGALTNTFGGRISDFRTKVVDAELANLQAVSATEASLKKRSAAAAPDFNEIFKLIASDEMHEIDSAADQAGIKAIHTDFIERAARDPFIMFSKERRHISNKINSYLQDPKRQTRIKNYKTNFSIIGSAREDGIAGNQYVNQGLVGGVKRRFGTIEDQYQVLDKKLGGQGVLNVSQGKFSEALKNIQATVNNVGLFKSTQFKGVDEGLDTIEKVVNSNNRQQLAIIFEGLKNQNLISESDYDTFLSRAATLEVKDAEIAGESINIDQLQNRAEVRAVDMFADIVNGKTKDLTTRSLSENSSLKGAGGKGTPVNIGPATTAFLTKNGSLSYSRTTANEDGSLSGTLHTIPTNEIPKSVLFDNNSNKSDGRESVRDNELFSITGTDKVENISIGVFDQFQGRLSEQARQFLHDRGRIRKNANYYDQLFYENGTVLSDADLKLYTEISESSLSEFQKGRLINQQIGKVKSKELMSVEIEVAFDNDNMLFSDRQNNLIEEFENTGIGVWEEGWDTESLFQYKEKAGIVNDDINEGSKRYVVTMTVPTTGKSLALITAHENNNANVPKSYLNFGRTSSSNENVVNNNFKTIDDVE